MPYLGSTQVTQLTDQYYHKWFVAGIVMRYDANQTECLLCTPIGVAYSGSYTLGCTQRLYISDHTLLLITFVSEFRLHAALL